MRPHTELDRFTDPHQRLVHVKVEIHLFNLGFVSSYESQMRLLQNKSSKAEKLENGLFYIIICIEIHLYNIYARYGYLSMNSDKLFN